MTPKKPSDLNPLFSDADATPEEIARARRIVAYQGLKEAAHDYHLNMREIDYSVPMSSPRRRRQDELTVRILELVLELFPETKP